MKSYWNLEAVPELKDLPKEERDRIFSAVVWKAFRHWQSWAALLLVVLLFYGGLYLDLHLLPMLGLQALAQYNILSSLGALVGIVTLSQVIIHKSRPYMSQAIRHPPQQ